MSRIVFEPFILSFGLSIIGGAVAVSWPLASLLTHHTQPWWICLLPLTFVQPVLNLAMREVPNEIIHFDRFEDAYPRANLDALSEQTGTPETHQESRPQPNQDTQSDATQATDRLFQP